MKLLKHKVYSHLVTRKHKKINNTKIKVYIDQITSKGQRCPYVAFMDRSKEYHSTTD